MKDHRQSIQSISKGSAEGVQSELQRIKQRDATRSQSKARFNLDPVHLEKLKDPANARDYSLYIPEGMSPDPKKALRGLSSAVKDLRKSYGNRSQLSNRSLSNPSWGDYPENIKKKGLSYKFKLNDLGKYSKTLRPNDIKNFKFSSSALGKIIPDESARRRKLSQLTGPIVS